MSFKSFLSKLVLEYNALASALDTLGKGIALPSYEKSRLEDAIFVITNAAKSISDALPSVKEVKVTINKKDFDKEFKQFIDEAVKKYLDEQAAKGNGEDAS